MKISKRLILKVAEELIKENDKISQIEIHREIEERMGRTLSVNEKRRITQILRNEYIVDRVERDKNNGNQRIFYFL